MAKNVRTKLTEQEKFAQSVMGNYDYTSFNMSESVIDNKIKIERSNKFNDEVEQQVDKLNKQKELLESYQKELQKNIDSVEIKPLFNRIMVKPFAVNPFQRIEVKGGIITDFGNLNPDIDFDQRTGEYGERDQNIIVATVVEVGPECKYIQVGDTVMYLKQLPTPVPFFKQGFWTIKEENIIAVVNEGLTERFEHGRG